MVWGETIQTLHTVTTFPSLISHLASVDVKQNGPVPSPPESLCIKMGSGVSHFNASLIVDEQRHNQTVAMTRNI